MKYITAKVDLGEKETFQKYNGKFLKESDAQDLLNVTEDTAIMKPVASLDGSDVPLAYVICNAYPNDNVRNLLASSTMIIGAIFAFQLGSAIDLPLGYIYGGIGGFFIYIALSDIVPTIHTSEKTRYGLQTGFLLIGLILAGVIGLAAQDDFMDISQYLEGMHSISKILIIMIIFFYLIENLIFH